MPPACLPVDVEKIPSHWTTMGKHDRCLRVDLQPSHKEYQDVAANFSRAGLTVKKVESLSSRYTHVS